MQWRMEDPEVGWVTSVDFLLLDCLLYSWMLFVMFRFLRYSLAHTGLKP